ncbi:MAG: lipocalin family protein [Flavitalea sp.]
MKKSLAILSIVFSMLFLFSCSKDKDEPASLVGKWQLQSATPNDDYDACDFQGYLEFKANNTVEAYDECDGETITGTYTRSGNTLTITETGFPLAINVTIVSLTNTTLQLQLPNIGGGVATKETYRRM